jgi:type VI secretion system protein VasD
VYQLKSDEGFLNKDFFSVFDPAGAALSADLVAREQITLQPGGSREFQAPFGADTKFVGVVGAFSDLERAEWRAVVAVPDADVLRQKRLRISVLDRAVAISIGEG